MNLLLGLASFAALTCLPPVRTAGFCYVTCRRLEFGKTDFPCCLLLFCSLFKLFTSLCLPMYFRRIFCINNVAKLRTGSTIIRCCFGEKRQDPCAESSSLGA